jgi:ABC-type glycerol-3-phosphate transport system substrate-binding protein
MQHYLIDEGGKPTFNAPEAVGVAKWLHRWQHVDKITSPATPSWTHRELYAGIQGGQCAMGRIGGWNVAAWETQPQPGKDFVVFGYPPMVKGQKSPAFQYSWSDGIVLAAKPKSPVAAVAYFKFLMGKQAQTLLFPVRSSWARTDLDFATLMSGNERMLYFAKPRPYAPDLSYHSFFLPILDILSRHLNAMIADPKSDPERTMKAAYDESMAKYKEMGGK